MRTSERNVAAPSRWATAGTINASPGGGAFGLELTGAARLIVTVVLVLRESFGVIRPLPPGALLTLIDTVPVFAPTGMVLVGVAFPVTVPAPLLPTRPDAG